MDSADRFQYYMRMQDQKKEAYAYYNYAGVKLELANIREREAELGSQAFEYVAKGSLEQRIGKISAREREIGLSFARYAVYGRTESP